MKALILRSSGYMPRIHKIRQLLSVLIEILKKLERTGFIHIIQEFSNTYRDELEKLDEAYAGARYLAKRYSKDKVEKLLKIARELLRIVSESRIFK